MPAEAWITLAVVAAVLVLLVVSRRHTDIVLMCGVLALMVVPVPGADGGWRAGVISPALAVRGLANEGVATIALLFVVAAGMRDTGAFAGFADRLMSGARGTRRVQLRLMAPAAARSAFMNNTPLVAMLLPAVADWARRARRPTSQLLLPLSCASILGGACSLLGTSSNLIVHGWLVEQYGPANGLGMFEMTLAGLPLALAGIGFVLLAGTTLLPARSQAERELRDPRQYTVEMMVEAGSPLVGRSISEAGLRHLPGLFLVEIGRDEHILPAVHPDERLRGGDRLVFVGVVESVADLQGLEGLAPAVDQTFEVDLRGGDRCLVEAVVSDASPLVGRTARDGAFRSRYGAVVIAVARSGRRIRRKVGDIRFRPGDTLLLETGSDFADAHRNSRDFYLVSRLDGAPPHRQRRSHLALAILAGMVGLVATGALGMLPAAALAAAVMVGTGCCTMTGARRAIDGSILLTIAAALGIGEAMQASGLASGLAHALFAVVGRHPLAALAAVLALTTVLANLVTAKAAVVMMLPIAVGAAADVGADYRPFAMAVMLAGATALATPVAFPTHLMVYGPGGYRFSDYLRIGVPLSVLLWAVALAVIPLVWPL